MVYMDSNIKMSTGMGSGGGLMKGVTHFGGNELFLTEFTNDSSVNHLMWALLLVILV